MGNSAIDSDSVTTTAAPAHVAPRRYVFTYCWAPRWASVWIIFAMCILCIALLLTPAIVTPSILAGAVRGDLATIELPSAVTFQDRLLLMSDPRSGQRSPLNDDQQALLVQLAGIGRLQHENSVRGYAYRFATTSFVPPPNQSWLGFFLWLTEPVRLFKGSLAVLAVMMPVTTLRWWNMWSPNNFLSPMLRFFIEGILLQFACLNNLAFRVVVAAAVVGFFSEVIRLIGFAIVTQFPFLAYVSGFLGLTGFLSFALLVIQTLALLSFVGGNQSNSRPEEFRWTDVSQISSLKATSRLSWFVWFGLLVAVAIIVGIATFSSCVYLAVKGPQQFTHIEHFVAGYCSDHGLTYQPAFGAAMLLITIAVLRRWLPPEFRHISSKLRRAIRLTRSGLRNRQPQITALWHTCQAVRLSNGSSLVSVQTTRGVDEPVFMVWDGDNAARYLGQRQREADDYRNRTEVPISKEVVADLYERLTDSDNEGLYRAIRDSRQLSGAAEPLLPLLIPQLSAESAKIRAIACEAIGYAAGPSLAQPLAQCLSDPDREVRYEAVWGLGRLGLPYYELKELLDPVKDDLKSAVELCLRLASPEAKRGNLWM